MPLAVHRTPRVRLAGPDRVRFDVPAPPPLEPPAMLQPVQLLVPVLGSLSILVYGVMAQAPVLLVTGGIMALASLASPIVLHRAGRRTQRAKQARRRERYLDRLAEVRAAVAVAKARLAARLADPHPAPGEYAAWASGPRLWERRRDDDDLLAVRLGVADVPSGLEVTCPAPPADAEPDEELTGEVRALQTSAQLIASAPLLLDLTTVAVTAIGGVREPAAALVRAVVLELALTCAPGDLSVLVAAPQAELPQWSWVKWLPHTAGEEAGVPARGGRGSARLVVAAGAALEQQLQALVEPRLAMLGDGTWSRTAPAFPHLLLVVDGFDPLGEEAPSPLLGQVLEHAGEIGVSVLALVDRPGAAPSRAGAVITVGAGSGRLRRLGPAAAETAFAPVGVDSGEAESLARALAPKRLAGSTPIARAGHRRLVDLLPGGAPAPAWAAGPSPASVLRVPFAVTADGAPLHLDLREAAEGGHGPHGLVVGAVGSGKSEVLRTLVCGLAATHGPDDVELAFADFKGGLTFSLLQHLPHCSGMVTNLADDLSLVDRMVDAVAGELERRQQLLRAAGPDVQKIGQYRRLRAHRPGLPPMPYLVLVVDEFGELLEARPDVLDVLLSVGRTGRSLGVHLVLAGQRLEIGRIRGLESYLGFRICLRTFTVEDSVNVLGSRAAADLPALPGHGYLRTADGTARFVAATVSVPDADHTAGPRVRPFRLAGHVAATARTDEHGTASEPADGEGAAGASVDGEGAARVPLDGDASDLAVLVRAAAAAGEQLRRPRLWLPPLPDPREPGAALRLDDDRLQAPTSPRAPGLPVPVGLLDLPRQRRQTALTLDPAAVDGHAFVVGAPGTGKTALLAAYAVQAARAHPAQLLTFHIVDLGGGGLAPLTGLPNVASWTNGADVDAVRRAFATLERIIDEHGRRLRDSGVHTLNDLRGRVEAGEVPGPVHAVLLLDHLGAFRERFADLDPVLGRLIAEGPAAGVHCVMTSGRWADLPPKRLEQVSTRVELRLNDPVESLHGRVRAAAVPAGVPGRGLVQGGVLVQLAHPVLDAGGAPDLPAAVRRAADAACRRWPGVRARPLTSLTDVTPAGWAEAVDGCRAERRVLLGLAETDLRPVVVPDGGTTLLAYGDPGSGRSRFLARLIEAAAALPEPSRPRVHLLDYLGSTLERCGEHVTAAAYEPGEAAELIAAVVAELTGRQGRTAAARRSGPAASGEPVTGAPARGAAARGAAATGAAATGAAMPGDAAMPPIWVVADDYELVHAAARPGLVAELAAFVPYARRLGLTVLLGQSANGSTARVDPLVRRILEGSPWHLQFSVESKLELLLRGTRGTVLPPGQAVLARPSRPDALLAVLPPFPTPVPATGAAAPRSSRPVVRLVS